MLNEHTKHKIIGGVVLLVAITASLPALLRHNAAKFAQETAHPVQFAKVHTREQTEIRRFVPRDIAHVSLTPRTIPVKTIAKAQGAAPVPVPKLASHLPSVSIKPQKPLFAKTTPAPTVKPTVAKPLPKKAKVVVKAPDKKPTLAVAKVKPHYQVISQQQYSVQLGSFASRENAESLIKQLRQKGYQAKYIPLVRPGGTLYKVVVGRLSNKDKAKLLNAKLSQAYHVQGFVVAYG